MTAKDDNHYDPESHQLICQGDWDLPHITKLQSILDKVKWPSSGDITIEGEGIKRMDSAGAWLLGKLQVKFKKHGVNVHLANFSEQHQKLLSLVEKRIEEEGMTPPERPQTTWLQRVGQNTMEQIIEGRDFLAFIGRLTFEAMRIGVNPKHIRWNALAGTIYQTGYLALPIIALLSFMIGVVLTYQMGLQLKSYGANIYIVDLLGLSVLREFGPLITAIMVAGRTGSAYTAQLGMMKLNQEIDALDTMGVTPAELLLLPRIMGLVISLPLLTMWADIFGVVGGMVMSNNLLGITWYDFLHRFPSVIPLRAFIIGIGKAPVFALIIASIGCYQGMAVENSAESVGRNTTRSVVLAIFFIIVADAIFSVIFSKLKL